MSKTRKPALETPCGHCRIVGTVYNASFLVYGEFAELWRIIEAQLAVARRLIWRILGSSRR
jgi:hypothetical protein